MMSDETMTIRQMCDAFDVTPRALRFYEAKELLAPQRRGTARLFTRTDRARLKLILRGKRFGFSLEDIRQILDLYSHEGANQAQLTRCYTLGQQRLTQMEAQRAELDATIAELKVELEAGAAMIAGFAHAAE
jgi:DNA-binding transcriptional MerR regulator